MHRRIDTAIWDNRRFNELPPAGRLMCLYMLSKPGSRYTISIPALVRATGLERGTINSNIHGALSVAARITNHAFSLTHDDQARDTRNKRMAGAAWMRIRRFVLRRDNHTCQYCGRNSGPLHCDHVVPISRGGTNALSNLVTACAPCNQSKRNLLVEEWER